MQIELFENAQLVKIQAGGRYSLFGLNFDENANAHKLEPLTFAQNQKSVDVLEDSRLIVLPDSIYSLDEKLVCSCGSNTEIKPIGKNYLIHTSDRLLLWSKYVILVNLPCQKYVATDKYIVVNDGKEWSTYRSDGVLIDLHFTADDVFIHENMLISSSLGRKDLYSIRNGKLLKSEQQRIICGDYSQFAICANITGNITALSQGKWHNLGKAEDFDIIDSKLSIFYLRRNGKCFLYDFNLNPLLLDEYPEGMDGADVLQGNILAIINDGTLNLYHQN